MIKMSERIKKIINITKQILVVVALVILFIRVDTLSKIVTYGFDSVNTYISQFEDITNTLVQNDIDQLTFINKLALTQGITNQKLENLNINTDLMLDGSVFVQSIVGLGGGTVIKKTDTEMYILTCYHVVEFNALLKEMRFDLPVTIGYTKEDSIGNVAGTVLYAGTIIKMDRDNDLALLKVFYADETLKEIKITEIEPQRGDVIYSVGCPMGFFRTLSKGILSTKIEGFYITDGTITFGNSGGGLFNTKGELIGIPAQVPGYGAGLDKEGKETFVPESGLGMSINLNIIKDFLKGVEY